MAILRGMSVLYGEQRTSFALAITGIIIMFIFGRCMTPVYNVAIRNCDQPELITRSPKELPSSLPIVDRNPQSSSSSRLIIINTMSYEHIYRRPNLARTAAQLLQAGTELLWVIVEDTHSLRKIATTQAHYDWILEDTAAFIATLGVRFHYITAESPFPERSARSTAVESHQRNQALNYSYKVASSSCSMVRTEGDAIRAAWRRGELPSAEHAKALLRCPVVYIADDDNVYMPNLWSELRKIVQVGLFPTGNMGFDGIEGPLVKASHDTGLGGRVTGFNSWHGSDPTKPKGWDKNGADRRFKMDMAGIAFNAMMVPYFTGPRYGYHETDIIEQTGVKNIDQIEGTLKVLAHHVHNSKANGRACYPIDWNYIPDAGNIWFNIRLGKTASSRLEACGCEPKSGALNFNGCSTK